MPPELEAKSPTRQRGRQPGQAPPQRRRFDHLPIVDQLIPLSAAQCVCGTCGARKIPQGTDDSEQIEIEVKAHIRRYRLARTTHLPMPDGASCHHRRLARQAHSQRRLGQFGVRRCAAREVPGDEVRRALAGGTLVGDVEAPRTRLAGRHDLRRTASDRAAAQADSRCDLGSYRERRVHSSG